MLTSGAAFTLTDGQDVQGIHPSCISAVYDAFTGKDVTDTIVQGSSRAQATPMEVFTAEAAPDDVPRVTVHTKEELQDALEYLTAAVEATQEAGQGGETSATEACRMTVQTTPPRALILVGPTGYPRAGMLGRRPCRLTTAPRSK